MASSIQTTGLASGLPINDIMEKLLDLSKAPIQRLEQRKAENDAKKTALQFISAQTLSLSLLSFDLSKTATFDSKKVTSSNENILTALTTSSAISGSYKFKIGQVAQAAQVTSNGVADKTAQMGEAGTLSIAKGNVNLSNSTELALLNGGKGVDTGLIRIADHSGNSETIDLTTSVSINDVINKINASSKVKVQASVSDDGRGLKVIGLTGDITISEVNNGNTAANLGIKGNSTEGTISGKSLTYVTRSTKLTDINDGLGIDIATKGINDMVITRIEGDKEEIFRIDLIDAKTLGDVVDKINETIGIKDFAYIEDGSDHISLQNNQYQFSDGDSGKTATQLGLVRNENSSGRLIAGLNDTLLRNLNGSLGISEGDLTITVSRANNSISQDTDFSDNEPTPREKTTATIHVDATGSLNDLLASINKNQALGLTASINNNGIEITDTHNDVNTHISVQSTGKSTAAEDLGLAQATEEGVIQGETLHKRSVSNNTLLSSMNNGNGIGTGSIDIQLSNGLTKTVSLASSNIKTLKDAVVQIQGQFSKLSELEVRINDKGDGIVLIDKTEGTGAFKVTDKDDQKTASALGIAKTNAIGNKTIDGSKEVSIQVLSTDSLEDIVNKINKETSLDVKAFIINDGSRNGGYRLNIVSNTTGAASNISIASNLDSLNFTTTIEGLDSIVSYGSSQGNATPITLTSSNLEITGINGLTLSLKGASDNEVTINIDRESETVKGTIQEFVDKFNDTIKNIKNLTRFVPPDELKDKINTGQTEEEKKNQADADAASGLLLGNSTLRKLQNDLYNLVSSNVEGMTGSIKSFSQIGISLQSDGSLKFDDEKFDQVFKTNTQEVVDIFTRSQNVLNRSTGAANVTTSGNLKMEGGFNLNNLLVDTLSSSGYSETGGDIGVKLTGTGYIDFNLPSTINLKKLVLNQIDTAEFPASTGLQKFKLQYKNFDGQFLDLTTYLQNTSGKVTYILPNEVTTNQIRLEILDGNPEETRLLSFQAFESSGAAFKLNDHLKKLTTPNQGDLATAISTYEQSNQMFDEQIQKIQERVDKESDRLTRQFSAMEKVISGLQGQSSVLTQSLSNLPKT